jgi:hypothetical protein
MKIVTILSSRIQGSSALFWREFLCFSKGTTKRYCVFCGTYELLDLAKNHMNTETGEYELPPKIDGKTVIDVVGDWIIGGNLTVQTPSEYYEFDTLLDENLLTWFISNRWPDDYKKLAALIL